MRRAITLVAASVLVIAVVPAARAAIWDSTLVAGLPATPGTDEGAGSLARFTSPIEMTFLNGKLYIVEANRVRVLDPANGNDVTTLTGSAATADCVNGTLAEARFDGVRGIAAYGGDLYVADSNNAVVRKIDIDGDTVTTLTGSSGAGCAGPGGTITAGDVTNVRFESPYAVAALNNQLWVTDASAAVLTQVDPGDGSMDVVAGSPHQTGHQDGVGSAARFTSPRSLAPATNTLYIADTNGFAIRRFTVSSGEVTTLAGSGANVGLVDDVGTAAGVMRPRGLSLIAGYLYFSEFNHHVIRRVSVQTKAVTTVAGTPPDPADPPGTLGGYAEGNGSEALFNNPSGTAAVPGALYIADTTNHVIRKLQIPLAVSSITTTVSKTASKVSVKGKVTPAHAGKKVTVTLFKKRSGTFRKIASKEVTLTPLSTFATTLARRAPGSCKVTSRFPGDSDHQASSKTVSFRC